jgi:hypothetical protein
MLHRQRTPDAPIEEICAATYAADLIPAFAFVFRVTATGTRFTVYASTQDAYTINGTYQLTLCDFGAVPLALPADDAEFLLHCLRDLEHRWQDAIALADAGAAQPEAPRMAEPGYVNVEPSPAGYHVIGNRFRAELEQVTRLRASVDEALTGRQHQDGDPS